MERILPAPCGPAIACILAAAFASVHAVNPVTGTAGKIDGVKTWSLPNTDNGLQPTQCWLAVGSSPDGDIYVAGMDHATNSALYRVKLSDDKLYYVGDARAASTAANNMVPNEPIQKFHTRPGHHNGRMYVANLNASSGNNQYLNVRGFHWYAYDMAQSSFLDLSATEPNGVATEHGGIVTLAIDHDNGWIYGAMLPLGNVYRYDIAQGRTTDLGRWPTINQQYVYMNRVMWVDSRHRLYTSGGNEVNTTISQPDDPAVFRHLHYYDPTTGWGEDTTFKLVFGDAIETGMWSRDRKHFFCSDDQGNLYRFDDDGPAWTSLGKLTFPQTATSYLWVFHLSADQKKIYAVPSDGADAVIEYDIAAKTQRTLCVNGDLSTPTGSQPRHTGYDAWDANGCFYYTTFAFTAKVNVVLTRVDPVRLKVAKGLLPALVTVSLRLSGDGTGVQVSRNGGATTAALDVIYDVKQTGVAYNEYSTMVGTITIPASQASITVPLTQLTMPAAVRSAGYTVSVVPDGNDYVAAPQRSATVGVATVAGASPAPLRGSDAVSLVHVTREGRSLRISVPEGMGSIGLSLCNPAGRALLRSAVTSGTPVTANLDAAGHGVYILRISANGSEGVRLISTEVGP